MQFNARVFLQKNGESYSFKAQIEFGCNPDDYGNGYHMGVRSPEESFGYDGYDIRYDTEFDPENVIPYIVKFYNNRYTGKNGSWKLVGIRVHEAEF